MSAPSFLAVIPARAGSKRLPGKNIKLFAGKPLIAHTISQALEIDAIDRVIVDTDSEEIAALAKSYGAEAQFLRPPELATDTAQVADSILLLLDRLETEAYRPEHVMVLQATSPLREVDDVKRVIRLMQESDATSVVTVCATHPRLYHLSADQYLTLVNPTNSSTNMQEWNAAYKLNGCFVYLVKTSALKAEKSLITSRTKAVVCDVWRSVDIDTPEEWALAELLFQHRNEIRERIASLAKGQ